MTPPKSAADKINKVALKVFEDGFTPAVHTALVDLLTSHALEQTEELRKELEGWHKLHDHFVETRDGSKPDPDFLQEVFESIETELSKSKEVVGVMVEALDEAIHLCYDENGNTILGCSASERKIIKALTTYKSMMEGKP